MITRRSLATLAAGATLLPSIAQAQAWNPRRTESFADGFPAPGRRPWAEQVPQLRVGLLGGENEADRMGRFGAYRELLERTFGVPTRLFPASDYAGVLQAFSAKQMRVLDFRQK